MESFVGAAFGDGKGLYEPMRIPQRRSDIDVMTPLVEHSGHMSIVNVESLVNTMEHTETFCGRKVLQALNVRSKRL